MIVSNKEQTSKISAAVMVPDIPKELLEKLDGSNPDLSGEYSDELKDNLKAMGVSQIWESVDVSLQVSDLISGAFTSTDPSSLSPIDAVRLKKKVKGFAETKLGGKITLSDDDVAKIYTHYSDAEESAQKAVSFTIKGLDKRITLSSVALVAFDEVADYFFDKLIEVIDAD